MKNHQVVILTPVYNDWDCFEILIKEISKIQQTEKAISFSIVAINDGSQTECPNYLFDNKEVKVHKIDLARNLGHQRAIAIGLCYIEEHLAFDFVVVMDSDGEDVPSQIPTLVHTAIKENNIVFAARGNRYETSNFKILYRIYKKVFRLLSGVEISFGNFSALPQKAVKQLVLYSELWNHFSGAIMKSKIKYSSLKIDRGKRYKGNSKMKVSSLMLHGFSSITIFLDEVALRLLMFSFTVIAAIFPILGIIGYMKIFTPYSTPGWATTVGLNLLNIIFQLFLVSLMMLFLVLYNRSSQNVIPKNIYHYFVQDFR